MTEELQKQRDILAERQAEEFVHIHTLSNLYAKQSFIEGFEACHSLMIKEIEILKSKNKDLEKIIAKEISENDEFGSEFVITSILRNKIDVAKKALERIEKYGNTSLCGEIAEQALKEME